jgi:hypothetical protein
MILRRGRVMALDILSCHNSQCKLRRDPCVQILVASWKHCLHPCPSIQQTAALWPYQSNLRNDFRPNHSGIQTAGSIPCRQRRADSRRGIITEQSLCTTYLKARGGKVRKKMKEKYRRLHQSILSKQRRLHARKSALSTRDR